MPPPAKKKVRQYKIEYLKLGFIASPLNEQLPMCLLCYQTLTNEAFKPSRLEQHLKSKHNAQTDKPLTYFESLRQQFLKRQTVPSCFRAEKTTQDSTLKASYEISNLIAKSGKPHTIGEELIKPSISIFLRTALGKNDATIANKMPLSNDIVRRRIDEMSDDVEEQLVKKLLVRKFSLQLDEATFCGSDAYLLAYVRYAENSNLQEEMLFCKPFETTTTATDIYNIVTNYFADNHIPMTSLVSCAADGAPAMMGKQNGCLKLLKDNQPSMMIVHCVIHRENLVAKNYLHSFIVSSKQSYHASTQ